MFWEIFADLCKQRGQSPSFVANAIGLSNSITTKWKRTGATPNGDVLIKLSEYFGVTTDYLLGLTKEKNKPTPEDRLISDFETGYDKLDADGKKLIDDLLKRLLSQQ